jgi:hypothetical protein
MPHLWTFHLFYIVTVCFNGEKRSKSKSGVKNKAHTIIPPTPSVFRLTYKLLKKKTYWNICLPLFWLQKPFQNNIFAHSVNREYYMALSVSHPVSTRDTNIIPRALARGLIRDVIRKEPYHIMFIIYLNMRKSCSVLWTFSHGINIILRGMIKGWWYRYQSRQTNTVVMFFQYYICKFP